MSSLKLLLLSLSGEIFYNLKEDERVIENWRVHHNIVCIENFIRIDEGLAVRLRDCLGMAKKPGEENVECESDAWQRFERAVDVVAKSPPQPKKKRAAKRKTTVPKSRGLPVKAKS